MKNFIDNATKKIMENAKAKPAFPKRNETIPKVPETEEAVSTRVYEELIRVPNFTSKEIEIYNMLVYLYFKSGRPRYFVDFERKMSTRFIEVIDKIPFSILTSITNRYHQFAKTVRPQNLDDSRQQQICTDVLIPFHNRLRKIRKNNPFNRLSYKKNPQNILIITRHALTNSMYAPGKIIFSVASSLVEVGMNVQVISLGKIDDAFSELMSNCSNFNVFNDLGEISSETDQFHELRDRISKFKPVAIFTETEVSILVAVELYKLPSPIFLISAGFYRIPWYSGVLVTQELSKQIRNLKLDKPFFDIPQIHQPENLAPYCDPTNLAKIKSKLNITDKFVIASFARYELFSEEFLLLATTILDKIPNSTLLLAGSNSRTPAEKYLKDYIKKERVHLLGISDISAFGYCCDVFLDTFPMCTGYAALESMAKGKPVFSLDCEPLKHYDVSRIKHLIFKTPEQLVNSLYEVSKNKNYYDTISIESKQFIEKSFYDKNKLSNALLKVIY